MKLSAFGKNPKGGASRVAFSQADLDAREYSISRPITIRGQNHLQVVASMYDMKRVTRWAKSGFSRHQKHSGNLCESPCCPSMPVNSIAILRAPLEQFSSHRGRLTLSLCSEAISHAFGSLSVLLRGRELDYTVIENLRHDCSDTGRRLQVHSEDEA